MWIHNLNPVLLSLGPFEIRWYGLAYVFGALFSLWWLLYWQKNGFLELSNDDVWDFVFYALVGVLVGARLFMIIWQPGIYLLHPLELLYVWKGGMSFHGGFVGIMIGGWLFCRRKKVSFLQIADLMSFPSLLALGLGRVANFMNGELAGRLFDGSWCVVFPGYDASECRHPSTLYAAGKRFLVAGWLYVLSMRQVTSGFSAGFIFWNFMFFEGLGRFIVDFWRYDELYFALSLGQWMSLIMVLVAGYFLFRQYKDDWKKIFA
ncbi:prolipoprotein diacylglyceryl transferase [archaeon]|jgi:phosphatidylglycerol---prolipoprotein diacylglyceryl transferase|nr:prolipoprotein diacylglyceryl transferase [archaeon]MBT6762778.1 prolipoprotein diacylglyceryl transferase [archaeon]